MGVARSAPHGAHYHAGVIDLMVLRVRPTPTRFPTNSLFTSENSASLHSIPSVARGGANFVKVCLS